VGYLDASSTVLEVRTNEEHPMKTKTIDARTAYAEVLHAAEEIRSDAHETIVTLSPGDVVRQGDLHITCLDGEPKGGIPAGTRQLAPGTTRGSRHVVEGECDVLRVPDAAAVAALRRVVPGADERQFVGPIIRARGPVTITHPQHGDRRLPGDACYLVTYQRSWLEEQARRQLD
jgi:hypothetical protein